MIDNQIMRFFIFFIILIFSTNNLCAALEGTKEQNPFAPENVKTIFDEKDYSDYESIISQYTRDLVKFYHENQADFEPYVIWNKINRLTPHRPLQVFPPDDITNDIPDFLTRYVPQSVTNDGKLDHFNAYFFDKFDPHSPKVVNARKGVISFKCANKPRSRFDIKLFDSSKTSAANQNNTDETIYINVSNHPTVTLKGQITYTTGETNIYITKKSERELTYLFLSELDLADIDDTVHIHTVQTNVSARLKVNAVRYMLKMLDKYCPKND